MKALNSMDDGGLTLEEAIAVFDGFSPAQLAKADRILDIFIQIEAHQEAQERASDVEGQSPTD